ncbi:hypothetical protein LR48_Vigan01g206200 [Vigna angularis]|uniref:Uncharacterized protein n=1 Tax=Phaseolus angularis TaxID=3914 RepID=A0A0L9TPW0_PHAAN|nr:hypothetical protein LR48_Vigan01g206200 [Vigna angularis]
MGMKDVFYFYISKSHSEFEIENPRALVEGHSATTPPIGRLYRSIPGVRVSFHPLLETRHCISINEADFSVVPPLIHRLLREEFKTTNVATIASLVEDGEALLEETLEEENLEEATLVDVEVKVEQ